MSFPSLSGTLFGNYDGVGQVSERRGEVGKEMRRGDARGFQLVAFRSLG